MAPSDISAVRLEGNEHEVDSLVACVQAAMAYWGHPVSYDYVAGLSGAAFSPALNRNRPCAAWWVECAGDARIEFVGNTLGFEIERSPVGAGGSDRAVSIFARHAADALESGGIVLCSKGRRWGIVTGLAAGTSSLLFATPGGAEESGTATPKTIMYILRPCERSLSRGEALRGRTYPRFAFCRCARCQPDT